MTDEEGLDFASAFGAKFGSIDSTAQRLKSERRAGLTTHQRARKATRTVQVNFRATPETKARADHLATHLDCSVADVIEQALIAFAQKHKLQK